MATIKVCDRSGCKNRIEPDKVTVCGVSLNDRGLVKAELCEECASLLAYAIADSQAMAMLFKGLKQRKTRIKK